MAEYYSLIIKAVSGLEKNTGEARRALYERARTALVAQLRGVSPELSESDITRERLALEEAIRKVEAESARKARLEQPRAAVQPKSRVIEPVKNEEPIRVSPPPPTESEPAIADLQFGEEKRFTLPPASDLAPSGIAAEADAALRAAARERSERVADDSITVTDAGLKGFRDVIAETDEIGRASARAAKSARAAYASVPSPSPEFDRLEPRLEADEFRASVRARERSAPVSPGRPVDLDAAVAAGRPLPTRPRPPRDVEPDEDIYERPARTRPARGFDEEAEEHVRPPRSYRGLITTLIVLFIISGLAATAYWQRANIAGVFRSVVQLGPGQQRGPAREQAQQRPKISDRVGGEQQQATAPARPGAATAPATQQQAAPAVAQRVVLYEEDTADPQGKRFLGSVIWRTETVSPGPGLAPELAIRADVEIPDRRLTMTFSLRRNTDQALPASHTAEVMFTLPADFPGGGISNVPGILMKQAEQTRGTPLAGLAVKVTTGFFLIGLSAVATDVERNVQLLKERSWFDIPVVYANGTRAILAVEKGTPGERVFNDAFAAWSRTGSAAR